MPRLVDTRTKVYHRAGWAPTQSDDANTRVNGFINAALKQLCADLPRVFNEKLHKFATQPDIEPESSTDTLSSTDDPWVIERDTADASLTTALDYDGRHDGRLLALKVGGEWRRHRIRTIWLEDTKARITLFEPAPPNDLYSEVADWRIYTEAYYLPPGTHMPVSARLHREGEVDPLEPARRDQAEKLSLDDVPDVAGTGRPRYWFAGPRFEMPTPAHTPEVSLDAQAGTWENGEDAGTFRYAFSLCWGFRDWEFAPPGSYKALKDGVGTTATADTAGRVPLWESALSEVSAEIEVTAAGNGIQVEYPDYSQAQGFNVSGSDREGRDGWYLRFYRRRTADGGSGAGKPEVSSRYRLIAENSASDASFGDAGLYPDMHTAPVSDGNYHSIVLYPRPDGRYVVDVRCLEVPQELADDYDALPVQDDAEEAVIDYALSLLLPTIDKADEAKAARDRYYKEHIPKMRGKYASDTPTSTVHYRQPARARRDVRSVRKWY